MALFIDFLTKKSKLIREIGELTGLKKSQIHCYKKIIKMGKTEDLRTTAFRKVLKSVSDSTRNEAPQIENVLIEEIEKLSVSPPTRQLEAERSSELSRTRSRYEKPHFFNEMEFSPG